MNRRRALGQLFLARFREFYREPEIIFWVYGFPLLLAVGLGLAFSSREPDPPTVDVQEGGYRAREVLKALQEGKLKAQIVPRARARKRLTTGETALLIVPTREAFHYELDETRPESVLARRWAESLLLQAENPTHRKAVVEPVDENGNRYIDFLMPGLMGMNLMGGGLWGVGFVIVDMRVRKLLKRFLATPMKRSHFLLAILGARMVFLLPEMLVLILVARFGFGVPINGSLLALAIIIVVGAAAFAGIGLLVACRPEKTETVSGLMNLVMLPMWLLSGTFFSSKRFPEVTQPFIQALPLTQLNDALREVMLKEGGLADVVTPLAILAAWAVLTFTLALRWFKWR
jgi:hypothetical protein